MLIKEKDRVKVGERYDLDGIPHEVTAVFSHHVNFMPIEEPFILKDVMNVDLMFKYHIYKNSNIERGVVCDYEKPSVQ